MTRRRVFVAVAALWLWDAAGVALVVTVSSNPVVWVVWFTLGSAMIAALIVAATRRGPWAPGGGGTTTAA